MARYIDCDFMIDINILRETPERVIKDLEKRGDKEKIKWIADILEKDKKWRQSINKVNELRCQRNKVSLEISALKKQKKDAVEKIAEMKKVASKIDALEKTIENVRVKIDYMLLRIPNIMHESVPKGIDDTKNVEVRKCGKIKKMSFTPKDHIDIGENLDLFDLERGAKVSGARFYYLKNDAVLLEFAIIRFALDQLRKEGYDIIIPPMLVREKVMEGAGFLPSGAEDIYKIEKEDLYLVGTSEQALAGIHMDETLDAEHLPKRYAGYSTCFRTEAGSHGRDTKGIFRVHQFEKIEMFVYTTPKKSWAEHEKLIKSAEKLVKMLELPYMVVNICTGDLGVVAAKKYDIDVWLPGQGKYRELVSCSNCTDYQARRLNIKYRNKVGESPAGLVHTLNSTAVAVSRMIVAILENYQQKDGSVKIPKVLVPYMGGNTKIMKSA